MRTIILGFCAIACAGESLGMWARELTIGVTILLLIGATLTESDDSTIPRTPGSQILSILSWLALLLLSNPIHLRLGAIAVFCALRAASNASWGKNARRWTALSITALFSSFVQFAVGSGAAAASAQSLVGAAASSIASMVAGRTIDFGPTFAGLDVFIAALVLIAARSLQIGRGAGRNVLVATVTLFFLWIIHFRILALLQVGIGNDDSRFGKFLLDASRAIFPRNVGVLALLHGIGAVAFFERSAPREAESIGVDAHPRRLAIAGIGAAAIATVVLLATPFRIANDARVSRIGFYEKGFLNWSSPNDLVFGMGAPGMFGLLPPLADACGRKHTMIESIDRDALAQIDVLVIANQDEVFTDDTLDAIDEFVAGGGGLVVIGDHTSGRHGKTVLNQPLRRTHIRFNFDNAEFLIGGWIESLDFARHPITIGLDDRMNDSGSVIGASLDVRYPAHALVVGRHGFSDPGDLNAEQNAYMGNRLMDPGERVGDVVLFAAENVGSGRVVVIGDTSAFVNGALPRTSAMVDRIFAWAGGRGPDSIGFLRELAAAAVFAGTAFGLALHAKRVRGLPLITAGVAFFGMFLSDAVMTSAASSEMPDARPSTASAATMPSAPSSRPSVGTIEHIAVIDDSRINRQSREGMREQSLGAVTLNLMRRRFFPVIMRRFDPALLEHAKIVFLIAPADAIGEADVESYADYLEKGGTVVLATGHEEREGAAGLLAKTGIRVTNEPLGRSQGEVVGHTSKPIFSKAWAVTGGTPLVTAWEKTIVARNPVGKGEIIVVGDADFFLDRNIETDEGAAMDNIEFMRFLLDRTLGD